MGCFLVCLGNPRHRKPRKWAYKTISRNQYHEATETYQATALLKEEDVGNPGDFITESKVRLAEQSNCSSKKKVTFDSNVQTYEVATTLVGNNVKKGNEKQEETKESKSLSDLITSSRVSSPPEHRYTSCVECNKEYQDKYFVESDLDDDDEVGSVHSLVLEESSESLFSLSIESRKHLSAIETGEKEVNSPMPFHPLPYEELKTVGSKPSESVHSILATIENLTQQKPVQAKITTSSENQEKENINSEPIFDACISPEPNLKQSNRNLKPESSEQDIGVDTSLSSWLAGSEFMPKSESSNISAGNTPSKKANSIRCLEKPKQVSALSSPGQSRRRSSNEELIMGTVGSYWSHTEQMDSESELDSSCRERKTTEGH